MKFYSYGYLQNKLEQNNFLEIIILGILVAILVITVIKYYRNRKDSKYRELSIILVLGIFLFVGIGISNYQVNVISSNQYKKSLQFIEQVSQHLNIDKSHIYINSEASIENAFVKIDDNYYRVIGSGKKDEYLLEKIHLIDPVVEKVEVNK